MKGIVLDSYSLITYLEKEEGYDNVSQILEECAAKEKEAFLCIINWGEVIYHALRNGGEKTAQLAQDAIKALPIQLVEANMEITLKAAHIKAFNKMSYADCFAVAVAMMKKCELATGDKEFKTVEKDIGIHWIA